MPSYRKTHSLPPPRRIDRAAYALPPGVPPVQEDPVLSRRRRAGVVAAVCAVSLVAGFAVARSSAPPPPSPLPVRTTLDAESLRRRLAEPAVRAAFEQLALDAIVRNGEEARAFAATLHAELKRAGQPVELRALGEALRRRAEGG